MAPERQVSSPACRDTSGGRAAGLITEPTSPTHAQGSCHAHAFAATACTADPAGCQMPAVAGRPLVAAPLEQKLFKAAITWWLPEAVSPESSHRYIVSCSTERIRFCREESELGRAFWACCGS